MFASLNLKMADRIVGLLTGTGPEGRARKAVTRFRRDPTEANKADAVTLLDGLEDNIRAELRQAARI